MTLHRSFPDSPCAAIEEAVVNAVYHRSYEIREPIEVRLTLKVIRELRKLYREKGPSRDQAGTKLRLSLQQVGAKPALSRHQAEILHKCLTDTGITGLMQIIGRKDRTKFRNQVLNTLLDAELIEMTIPEKPTSPKQKYRLTEKARLLLKDYSR